MEKDAEARRVAILDEQQKLAQEVKARAEAEARKRAAAEAAAAQLKALEGYKRKISQKIRGYIVLPPGINGNPEAVYSVTVVPGGEVLDVKLVKSSGVPAYDAAVERAIQAAKSAACAHRPRHVSTTATGEPTSFARSNEESNRYTHAHMKITGRPWPSRRADSKHRRAWCIVASVLLCLCAATARAQLTIEVIGGGADQIPITVLPLADEEKFQQRISQIVSADLIRSGRFKVQEIGSVRPLPSEPPEVNYRYWKNRGTQTLVIGKVIQREDGKVEVRFRMLDTSKEAQAVGYAYTIVVPQMRAIAHKIADTIYEKLTGEPGVFSTRIAYVARFPQRFELHVADADGFNSQFILAHREPIISPAWSPDGTRIAYVSFEQGRSIVFIHNLVDGTRRVLASYDGINSAPAWSPDGKRLALALSKDGVSQIYMIDADGGGLVRLTNSNAIDTEASFLARRQVHLVHLGSRRQSADLSHERVGRPTSSA